MTKLYTQKKTQNHKYETQKNGAKPNLPVDEQSLAMDLQAISFLMRFL